MIMTHITKIQKRRIREEYVKNNFDLNNIVDFWGQKMRLDDAIEKFDSDDLQDAKKQIWQRKHMGL